MDPEKATRAAAHHLHDLYSEFGDWYLAIAAYNCGPGVVEKAVERTGYADFWELRARGVLPVETTNYVPIILAMTIMEKNAAEYGLAGTPLDPPLEYDSVETDAPTSLALVSDITDTPLPELAALNPALLKGMAPAKYSLHVPKGTGNQIAAAFEIIPSEHRNAWRMHRVGSGETLAGIARRYSVTAGSIVAANKLASSEAVEGDRLVIPAVLRTPATPVRTAARRTTTAAVRHARKPGSKAAPTRSATARPAPARKPSVIVASAGSQ
jgi:membrane-bound lytic murein transglycosylase D